MKRKLRIERLKSDNRALNRENQDLLAENRKLRETLEEIKRKEREEKGRVLRAEREKDRKEREARGMRERVQVGEERAIVRAEIEKK